MAAPSVTYAFSNGTAADATQVNQNFTDLINSLTDKTKTIAVSRIGVGIIAPTKDIHVYDATNGTATIYLEESGGGYAKLSIIGTGAATTADVVISGGGGSTLAVGLATALSTVHVNGISGADGEIRLTNSTDAVAYAKILNMGGGGNVLLRGTANTRNISLQTEAISYIKTGYRFGVDTSTPTSMITAGSGDIETMQADKGLIMCSTNGTRYRIHISDLGAIGVTAV